MGSTRTIGLLLAAALVPLAACSDDDPLATACVPGAVEGSVSGFSVPVFDDGQDIIGFRVEGAQVAGDVGGTADADFAILSVDQDGTFHLEGSHTFRDGGGEFLFRTSDSGLTTAAGAVENHMTVVEGGSGTLDTEGTVDLETGALELQYGGELCL